MAFLHYFLILSVLVVVFVAADWNKDPAINKPFNATQKIAIKACLKNKKKSGFCSEGRVCTEDGKGWKNMCKLQCARESGWYSPELKGGCPASYHAEPDAV
ncbi:hypothetical protein BV898_04542 [Hypsibius exemplaris]|uniref:Kazal-like domain-containing protein n=1 Tax=Hypsibius exemplaris TaxID=2072580 RepID=A0A1W0X2D3_HYPEX|nr:hypothetical protein BV898_04542 [Hypsibius exemplaris]